MREINLKNGTKRNIIFLDVDGVLNSMAYFEQLKKNEKEFDKFTEISDFHLQKLAEIYHACNCKIVLTSTWRDFDELNDKYSYEMWQYLISSLANYNMEVIGKTPIIDNNRPLEIKTWLDEQPDKNSISFISLDDDFCKKDYHRYGIHKCLVHTDFYCKKVEDGGLQQTHVDKAIKKLKEEAE